MNRYYLCQLNYEGPNSAEGFLQNLFSCYVIAFAQLGVIPRTRNKFDKIVAVAECYLFTNHLKNEESKRQLFQKRILVKLADGRMPVKKETKFFILNL